ncbi:MAG TPA: ABC transporter permease, partial [Alphaproteobacteria bacterium]|nr:ABC transporter permease [Alphaproteobacteria bacterium]
MSRATDWGWRGFGAFVVMFMMTPLILVVLFSFGESAMANFPIERLTLKWYHELFAAREFWNAFRNSMVV